MKSLLKTLAIASMIASLPMPVLAAVPMSVHLSQNQIESVDPRAKDVACTESSGGKTDTKSVEEFVDTYGELAFNTGKTYGIPYEAIIAQAILESSYGRSQLTQKAFNFFGIKAGSSWTGPTITFNTEEEGPGGGRYTEAAAFRKYSSAQEGFNGYGDFITSLDRYKNALKYPGDPAAYIAELKKAGYATDSAYVTKNVNLQKSVAAYIRSKNLFPPSSEVTPNPSPPTNNPSAGSSNCGVAGEGAAAIVSIAERELDLKPVEYDKNVMKYTQGRTEPWCADFVSWVYKEAGVPIKGARNDGWNEPSTLDLQALAKSTTSNLRYFEVGDEPPQPGDIAFYFGSQTPDGGSTRHVNIVVEVSANGKRMTVIGGNQSDKVTKYPQAVSLGEQSLVGFARLKE